MILLLVMMKMTLKIKWSSMIMGVNQMRMTTKLYGLKFSVHS